MLRFSELTPAARSIWAKSGDVAGHGLICHMLDVAAVAETLLERESPRSLAWAAEAFGLPSDATPRWIAACVGLHDFGKAIPGFQCKWPEGKAADEQAGLAFRPASTRTDRHDLASTVLLQRALASRAAISAAWVRGVSFAVGAHHGHVPGSRELSSAFPRGEAPAWGAARQEIFEAYWGVLAPVGEPRIDELVFPFAAWLAGLTSVADWIGSNQAWFPPGERAETLHGHHRQALELAGRALDDIGWPRFRALGDSVRDVQDLLQRVVHSEEPVRPRPLQLAADRLLHGVTGPTLVLVEAPMGEGKTEVGFLAHLRLQSANAHRGLYVALPTQATGNAMFDRTRIFLESFAGNETVDLQRAHGAARMDDRVLRLRDIDASVHETIASSAWFAQRRRPLLSPYGVGTVDQALFATLNVKHHFVRLWGLANRVVVLDEIHAYDTYTSGLIEALLRWLKAMGCSVVLMSATLPARRRADLLAAWDATSIPDLPYPRVLLVNRGRVRGEHVSSRGTTTVHLRSVNEDLPEIADSALAALAHGGCGAIIVNTVQRAQDLFRLLQSRIAPGDHLLLFHARYPMDERSRREGDVLRCFGRGESSQRPAKALIVATQVVEQSLDIDFDFLISDLAPIDLLLQRAGRLHRHADRLRPVEHREPRLIVAGLDRERPPELRSTRWGFVYDPYLLYRTWLVIRGAAWMELPGDIDRLVQIVYGSDPLGEDDGAESLQALDSAFGKHLADQQVHRQRVLDVSLQADAEFETAYFNKPRAGEEVDEPGLRAVTRLGDEGIAVVPLHTSSEGWRLDPHDATFEVDVIPDDLAKRIYKRQVRLSRPEVAKWLAKDQVPPLFAEHPLLRDLVPLPLTDGVAIFDRLRVRLDPDLGIIYESAADDEEAA